MLDTVRRVVYDLFGTYQNGISLERVYHELLMKESITSRYREACELIRNSMTVLLNLRDVQAQHVENVSVPSDLDVKNPVIGWPKFCIART